MPRRLSAAMILLTMPFLLGGCGLIGKAFHRKPKPTHEAPHDVYIGVIESVNPEHHFVLIRTTLQLRMEPGWRLETRPASGSHAVLTVSPEKKMNFLSADIVEGLPQRGESVVMPPQLSSTTPTPDANAIPPLTPPSPPVPQAPPKPVRAPTGEELPPPIQ